MRGAGRQAAGAPIHRRFAGRRTSIQPKKAIRPTSQSRGGKAGAWLAGPAAAGEVGVAEGDGAMVAVGGVLARAAGDGIASCSPNSQAGSVAGGAELALGVALAMGVGRARLATAVGVLVRVGVAVRV